MPHISSLAFDGRNTSPRIQGHSFPAVYIGSVFLSVSYGSDSASWDTPKNSMSDS